MQRKSDKHDSTAVKDGNEYGNLLLALNGFADLKHAPEEVTLTRDEPKPSTAFSRITPPRRSHLATPSPLPSPTHLPGIRWFPRFQCFPLRVCYCSQKHRWDDQLGVAINACAGLHERVEGKAGVLCNAQTSCSEGLPEF